MITYNTPLYQALSLVARYPATSNTAGSVDTGGASNVNAVDMGLYGRALFKLDVTSVAASTTVDFKLQAAKTKTGTYVDIPNFAITQITSVGASGTVKEVEISTEQLIAAETTAGSASLNSYRYVKGVVTVGGSGAAVVAVDVWAVHGRFKPETLKRTLSDGTTVILPGQVAELTQVISPKSSSSVL